MIVHFTVTVGIGRFPMHILFKDIKPIYWCAISTAAYILAWCCNFLGLCWLSGEFYNRKSVEKKVKFTENGLFFCVSCALQVGWKRRPTIDQWSISAQTPYIFHLFLPPRHSIPGKTHLQMPCPLKDKNSFEAIFITTAPKIKNSKSTFTTFYIDPAPLSPHLLWYSLHVFSHCCVHKPIYLPNGSCILCM